MSYHCVLLVLPKKADWSAITVIFRADRNDSMFLMRQLKRLSFIIMNINSER